MRKDGKRSKWDTNISMDWLGHMVWVLYYPPKPLFLDLDRIQSSLATDSKSKYLMFKQMVVSLCITFA